MLFPTMAFGLFFLVVFTTAWSLERENWRRKAFLVLASWVFYGWWDWRFVGLLIFSATMNWAVAELIDRSPSRSARRWWVTLGVVVNLAVLGVFKYYGFFVEQLGAGLDLLGLHRDLPLLQVVLPIGVSFFTFQGVSYLVDVHKGECEKAASLLDVMLLLSFFPHLVAGPIVRARDLLPQFAQTPRPTRQMLTGGLLLIVWGLFKKTVVASELASGLVDPVFLRSLRPRRIRPARGDLWLRGADLLRLLGLQRHRHRRGGPARLPLSAQLRPALSRRLPARVLAALAHQPVELAARLCLHPPGRRGGGPGAHLPQPDDHPGAGGPVARRGLDLRGLGGAARRGPMRRAGVDGGAAGGLAARCRRSSAY